MLGGAERYVFNIAHAQTDLFPEDVIRVRSLGRLHEPVRRSISPDTKLLPVGDVQHNAHQLVADLLANDTPDVWHVHQHRSPLGMAVLFLLRSLGQKVVVTDLGWVEPWDTRAFRISDLADVVVAISDHAAALDSTTAPTIVMKGGVRIADDVQERAGEGCVFVGRLLPHKGALDLVKAMPSGSRLRVAGAVSDKAYAAAVGRICREKKFDFVPNASDETIAEFRREAAIGLVPTLDVPGYEYMGLSALEFLAAGLPVVAIDSGALREFVIDGENGLLANNHDDLAGKAVRLSENETELNRLWHGAVHSARRFCCHEVSKSLHDVYTTLGAH